MTIKPGEPWGSDVDRPAGLHIARSDPEVVEAVTASSASAVAVGGGDLARTLGNPRFDGRPTLRAMPIDLVEVRLDGGEVVTACAHVVARSSWVRGGWWRGDTLLVMNGEFRGDWDVASRGHPNDGRVETFAIDAGFGWRDRAAARRRLPSGSHVPHPAITTRSVRAATWSFDVPRVVIVDGRRVGRARILDVVVIPDAAIVYA